MRDLVDICADFTTSRVPLPTPRGFEHESLMKIARKWARGASIVAKRGAALEMEEPVESA